MAFTLRRKHAKTDKGGIDNLIAIMYYSAYATYKTAHPRITNGDDTLTGSQK